MDCCLPSSVSMKSSCFKSLTGRPDLSNTIRSTCTSSDLSLNGSSCDTCPASAPTPPTGDEPSASSDTRQSTDRYFMTTPELLLIGTRVLGPGRDLFEHLREY